MSPVDPALLNVLKQTINRILDDAILSVTVKDPSALVDVSGVHEAISRSFNKALSERVQSINTDMSPIERLPEDVFLYMLDVGAFSLVDRLSIARVSKRWLEQSRSCKAAVTISKPLDELTLSEIDDLDFGLRRVLHGPSIVHLSFRTAEFSRPPDFRKLTRFLEEHISTAQTVECPGISLASTSS
ncbi:hypothetical protein EXIGLDRAFT_781431 [Exidia glandulosa HHB12029]|uniref:F-box domain-containing protein n=1 Tax=Exidia glandulosa HHB12029 TaxID=1314781 RepID=A0A165Z7H3_EXIGL|nr:hypothetical protein EXIGLDRAFT_781431 [Exidia glandulosa HHB12029]